MSTLKEFCAWAVIMFVLMITCASIIKRRLVVVLAEKFSDSYILGLRVLTGLLLLGRLGGPGVFSGGTIYVTFDRSFLWNHLPILNSLFSMQYFPILFKILFCAGILALIFEIKPKITVPILFLMTVVGESFRSPTHGLFIIGLALFGFVVYYLLFWEKGNRDRAHLIFPIVYFLVGSLYFNAFISKSGYMLNWISGKGIQGAILFKSLVYISIYFGNLSNFIPNKVEQLILQSSPLAIVFSVGVLLLQFSSLFLVFLPKVLRSILVLSLIMFHVSIYRILGIDFSPNIIILTYLLFDWPVVIGFLIKFFKSRVATYV